MCPSDQFQSAAESLNHRDGAALAVRDAVTPRAAAVPGEHRVDEHAEHGATELVVERQPIAQPMRYGQYPLAHGHDRQDRVHEVGRLLGHQPHNMMRGGPTSAP